MNVVQDVDLDADDSNEVKPFAVEDILDVPSHYRSRCVAATELPFDTSWHKRSSQL